MKVHAIKTEKITPGLISLFELLDKYITEFSEKSILAITSKVISICEDRVVPVKDSDKDELVKKEADLYLPKEENKYGVYLTIKDSQLVATAGIDESNGVGYYILWPANPQKSANQIREYLTKRFNLKKTGVLITDSKTTPLRWGTSGVAVAHSGFRALKNYIGTEDLFGRKLKMTKASVIDGLAAAAVFEMGEGSEQTPLAVISDIPQVEFVDRNPTEEELKELEISIEDDLYGSILKRAPWKRGKNKT
ncbi:MAG: hypothetical protein A2868_02445 [Candidatus Levybacteria bacterium RIFCSPHIGHO2_01_FULL_40_15b]|nr:MAG: hypothetical protein A2868_02445 [Candidatus Levybacteria bacterium RIFCSPHIGHO2_01_FULL_40_15b]